LRSTASARNLFPSDVTVGRRALENHSFALLQPD
jgi:hypothetical protein